MIGYQGQPARLAFSLGGSASPALRGAKGRELHAIERHARMDWFERLTGFQEAGYEATRGQLRVQGDRLVSLANGRSWRIGILELPSLAELRQRVAPMPGASRLGTVSGDVRALHRQPDCAGALFQVASQFNLLEMTGPDVSPEDGVTRYAQDRTQGPACAIAAGAATIFRNYFAPCGGGTGQTRKRQIDTLADLAAALGRATGRPAGDLWHMRNGYALASAEGLQAIAQVLQAASAGPLDELRGLLRIGVHAGVEVTGDAGGQPGPLVSQAFCSALPVAYTPVPAALWAPLATLVLEAAYEATLLAAAHNACTGGSNVVLLTLLGGGAFGNDERWIHAALERALHLARHWALDVRIVCHGRPSVATRQLLASLA